MFSDNFVTILSTYRVIMVNNYCKDLLFLFAAARHDSKIVEIRIWRLERGYQNLEIRTWVMKRQNENTMSIHHLHF